MRLTGLVAAAMAVSMAGIGHNGPPVLITPPGQPVIQQAVMPRRIVVENRRNQKLKQKLRKRKRVQWITRNSRFQRKAMQFGNGYRPGKLFKGHRI